MAVQAGVSRAGARMWLQPAGHGDVQGLDSPSSADPSSGTEQPFSHTGIFFQPPRIVFFLLPQRDLLPQGIAC